MQGGRVEEIVARAVISSLCLRGTGRPEDEGQGDGSNDEGQCSWLHDDRLLSHRKGDSATTAPVARFPSQPGLYACVGIAQRTHTEIAVGVRAYAPSRPSSSTVHFPSAIAMISFTCGLSCSAFVRVPLSGPAASSGSSSDPGQASPPLPSPMPTRCSPTRRLYAPGASPA